MKRLRRGRALVADHGEPAPLGRLAALLAAGFVVAFLSSFSEDDKGGVTGWIFIAAIRVTFIWILAAASIVLLSEQRAE